MTAWPRIPIHAALLPDGKVATFGANPRNDQGGLDVDIWDPKLGLGNDSHITLPNGIDVDSFCVGQVLEPWSGNLLMVGGSTNAADRNTFKTENFSFKTKRMTRLQDVRYPRWYATTTSLPDGRIIVNGGVKPYDGSADASTTAEIYAPGNGWTVLNGTTQPRQPADDKERRYWYPHVYPTEGNKVFVVAGKVMYRIGYDGNGSVGDFQAFTGTNWGGTSTAVMFAPNKILQFGGGITHNEDQSAPPGSKNASIIDFSTYPYKVTETGAMAYGRHWLTGTLLPTGEVLATGGAEGNNTMNKVAYAAEIWNPNTGQWRVGASMRTPRLYHSSALLLPDGRVLVGGGGAPGPIIGNNVEIYSPPYLFDANGYSAKRPEIASEPGIVKLGQTVTVQATGPRPITRFTMIKTGSVTHSFNTDQRFLDVPFTKNGDSYDLKITSSALEATPGYYMLFALDEQGVPSIARMMRLPSPIADNGDLPPTGQNGETGGFVTVAPGTTGTPGTGNGEVATVPAHGVTKPLIAAHSNLCLSVQGGSNADGAQIVQETCTGAPIQQWTWNAVNGGYTLVNKQTNKCLDDYGFNKNDGAKLNQWTCLANDAQIWRPTQTNRGLTMTVKASNKCLDVLGASLANGATVTQWACNGQANQAWLTGPRSKIPDNGTTASLVASHSNLCLSVQGGSYADGAQIIQESCTGAAIQQWTWKAVNGGYTLVNKQTNKCLDDYGFSKNDGAKLNQWTCLANDAQIWRPTETDKGLTMTVKASNKCLDVLGVSLATGATVTQWVCNGQGNQAWRASVTVGG
ncbi:RICIN domain-containing protein [Rhizobium sp. NFR03]|uniref:RICIN domain-containing protein n=1 Tax=Rhizobium sp. NFR03 TaxID=1566263 RepID=UPI001114C341|nr:RICIN domain-containing protein [Rhizobium sp. NFR03]